MNKFFFTKENIYKDNTLLLKKGSVVDNHILKKLHNFGFELNETEQIKNENHSTLEIFDEISVLIADTNEFACAKTKKILESSILKCKKIFLQNNKCLLKDNISQMRFNYIFIDYELFSEDILDEIFLHSVTKTVIFVTNSGSKKLFARKYNTDHIKINFLYRPIAKGYIDALIKISS